MSVHIKEHGETAQEFVSCCAERRKQPLIYKIEFSEALAAAATTTTNNQQTQLAGRLATNVGRNRNQDVIPFDENRVKLSDGGAGSCDYINASYCSGLLPGTSYIVTQGRPATLPAKHTDLYWDGLNEI